MNKCLNTVFANEHPKCLLDGADFGVRRSITLSRFSTKVTEHSGLVSIADIIMR